MKNILLLATGGTIASKQTESGLVPQSTPEEILDFVPECKAFCKVDAKQVLNIDSTNIQPEHWCCLAGLIRENYAAYDGFVITHGTDTMAYTAAALSYLVQNPEKPIVLTGAQKPMNASITDARKNLLDSLRFAADSAVRGVYIVFDGKAIVGTRARKVRSKSYSAFESINYPAAAFLDERRIIHYIDESGRPGDGVRFSDKLEPSVFLLKLVPGMEPDVLDYIAQRYDGIVIESYGVGGVPFLEQRNFLEKLDGLTRLGKIVVIATQVMLEGSDAELYEVGFRAVRSYHVLQAYDMTVEAAVVKLMWILAQTRDFELVKRAFYTCINSDILAGPEEPETV